MTDDDKCLLTKRSFDEKKVSMNHVDISPDDMKCAGDTNDGACWHLARKTADYILRSVNKNKK